MKAWLDLDMPKVIAFLHISSAQLWAWIAALSMLCHISTFFSGIVAGEIEFLMVDIT